MNPKGDKPIKLLIILWITAITVWIVVLLFGGIATYSVSLVLKILIFFMLIVSIVSLIASLSIHQTYSQEIREKNREIDELTRLSLTDGRTGIANSTHFESRLEEETQRSKRANRELSLVFFDIDGFREFNRIFGHQAGNQVLRQVATTISTSGRRYDFPTRYGGDEFTVILPETDLEEAQEIAKRYLVSLSNHPFVSPSGEKIQITLSIGITQYQSEETPADLIFRANQAMFSAKNNGGNQIQTA